VIKPFLRREKQSSPERDHDSTADRGSKFKRRRHRSSNNSTSSPSRPQPTDIIREALTAYVNARIATAPGHADVT
jgi:hypothetical protein